MVISSISTRICATAATIGLSIGWLLVQLVPEPIVSMFNSDAELVSISVDGIRKYLSMMPLIGVSMIGSNYFQAIGKAKHAMVLSLLRQVILLVPMMLILPRILMMPLIGVSMIGSNYFQAIGKAKHAMVLSLLRQVILLVPMMLILPRILGLNGVWFAQPIADLISFVVTAVLLIKEVKSDKIETNDKVESEIISLEV